MIAIGSAIGTGLFLGSGMAIGFAGPSVLISYAIGGFIALLIMGCLTEMAVAHPTSGSFGSYAEFYIHPAAGFLVRYSYWVSIVFAVGTEVTAIAVYMKYWFPDIPGWLWIAGFSAILIAVNSFNVRIFGRVEYAFSTLKVSAIVLFIALGAYIVTQTGFANYNVQGGFLPKGVSGAWISVIVAVFSYLGIEMVAVAAGEAENPQRAITRAFHTTFFRLVFFYLATLGLMLAIVPWTAAGSGGSPFVKVMSATHVPYAAGIMNFVILIAALSAMNSQFYITTRMMFSLARAGHAHPRFGKLSSRGVPLAALFISTVGIAVGTLLVVVYPDTAFTLMMSISMFGAMFTWFMIFVTHLFFRRKHHSPAFRMWGYPYATLLGAALMLGVLITTLFVPAFRMTLVFGLPFLATLYAIYRFRYHR
jgi:AAT family amino acid transporter